ncbi:BatA domain-containing protein [Rufibacter ruber]|uniref:BatA domain-containing protein n=1 Tax=Rufibacter ruber TaxID=1783499 RepID=UPI0008368A6D|nr:BatA domain-containing protein [Rufibacter ruber]
MFQFLNPVWLWAMASVAVPIAIHLWNKRQPKTVQVGSIRWLQPSESRKLSSLRLTQPWLLLLRCLLLLLLALVLAQPQFKRKVPAVPEKHVYLHPALFQAKTLPLVAATVDSLAQKGWQIHKLQSGFPALPLTQETSIQSFQADSLAADTTNAWAMLRVLNRSLPSHAHAWIFTTDLLRHHRGTYPQLHPTFKWIPVPVPQTNVWLQDAYYTSKGQLRLQFGRSDAQEVTFLERTVAKPAAGQTISLPALPGVRFSAHAEADSLTLQGGARNTIPLAKEPLRVLVRYAKSRQADVKYLRAALQTALEYRGAAFELAVSGEPQPLPAVAPDWVFWLSDEPLAPFLARFSKNRLKTLQDAPASARVQKLESWLQIPSLAAHVPLHQRTQAPESPTTQVLWQDGYGHPMLTQQLDSLQTHFRFYSRFHSTWNALPDNGQFPELLLRLLFPENSAWETLYDTRTLPQELEQPRAFNGSFLENRSKTEEVLDLKPWLLGLLALLLAVERWLAGRGSKPKQATI